MHSASKAQASDQVQSIKKVNPYSVVNVEKIDTPEGLQGDNWYRYVIDFGRSTIEGKKAGTLKLVREHAEAVVEDLNSRSFASGNSSTYASRNRKQ